jgi:hypothetical protein
MFRNRANALVCTLAVLVLMLGAALVVPVSRNAILGLFGREKVIEDVSSIPADTPRQIHPGITVHGAAVPVGISATPLTLNASDYPVDPKQVIGLSDLVTITPEGKLPSSVTLTFTLKKRVNLKSGVIFVATRKAGQKDWTFVQPQLSKDGTKATVQVDHFSNWWTFFWDTAKFLANTGDQYINGVLSNATTEAEKPRCDKQYADAARKDNYSLDTSGSALYTCFARKSDKDRELTIVNKRRYPLEIKYGGFKPVDTGKVQADFANIARFTVSGKKTILYPFDAATYSVKLAPDEGAKLTTSYSGTAAAFARLDIALEIILLMTTKMGKAPLRDSYMRMRIIDDMMGQVKCVNSLAAADLGKTIRECFTREKLDKWLGNWAPVVSALASVVGVINWLRSELNGLGDQLNGRDKAAALIVHSNPMERFVGKWFIHDGSVTINKNLKTGVETSDQGQCNFDKGDDRMCTATYRLRFTVSSNTLKATYMSIDVKDQYGDRPFDIGTDGEIVGKSYTITYVRKGLLSRDMKNVTEFEEFRRSYLCNDETSEKDKAKCGV